MTLVLESDQKPERDASARLGLVGFRPRSGAAHHVSSAARFPCLIDPGRPGRRRVRGRGCWTVGHARVRLPRRGRPAVSGSSPSPLRREASRVLSDRGHRADAVEPSHGQIDPAGTSTDNGWRRRAAACAGRPAALAVDPAPGSPGGSQLALRGGLRSRVGPWSAWLPRLSRSRKAEVCGSDRANGDAGRANSEAAECSRPARCAEDGGQQGRRPPPRRQAAAPAQVVAERRPAAQKRRRRRQLCAPLCPRGWPGASEGCDL